MVDAVVEGRVVVPEAQVVVSEAATELVVLVLEAGAEVPRAELLEGSEDLLLLSPYPPERLDTEDPAELQHNLADLQLSAEIVIPIDHLTRASLATQLTTQPAFTSHK